MFDEEFLTILKERLRRQTQLDSRLLRDLQADVRPLRGKAKVIQPRGITSISVVASDGGNNGLQFDPFFLQVVRVADSCGKVLFGDVVSPTMFIEELDALHLDGKGTPRSPLGRLMVDLGARTLSRLSPMIPPADQVRYQPNEITPGWIQVYRDLCEWAAFYDRICYHNFGTDTLVVRDGLLRSKVFRGDLFVRMMQRVKQVSQEAWQRDRRRIFVAGMAKHSKVIDRYQLALDLEGILPPGDPLFLGVPRELEAKTYTWDEWARGAETNGGNGEAPKFNAGSLYLVRFGARTGDPVWPVDILESQVHEDIRIFGHLLADARDGFPVQGYPRCLQKAHDYAQVAGFDQEILQDQVFEAIREVLPLEQRPVLDRFRFRTDFGRLRYT